MKEAVPVDEVNCPAARCSSEDVVLVYEAVFGLGDETAKQMVLDGAECRRCGFRFVTSQVRELALEYRPDPDEFTIDRNI